MTRILPWATIELSAGEPSGPTIEGSAMLGTGAKVLGAVRIGRGAKIGANATVLDDVPAGTTAVGSLARTVDGGDG